MSERIESSRLDLRLWIPVLILIVTILAEATYQNVQLRRDRQQLDDQYAQQKDALESAQKLRAQLEAIAGDTAVLADQGNPNAVRLRDFLTQQGVNIKPPPKPE